jgi:hypothetical protein
MDLNFHCYTSGKRTREPLLLEGQGWRNWRARALTKHIPAGKMKRPRCTVWARPGPHTAHVPEWRNWQTR